ncbi:hypothetical protein SAMN05421740_11382 [Parapedobacter koreensis]|uniref:Uncharacterized protein n=1 Tax=Parapedobacter koreensis TaxID=332977 RepID=A0A1H7U3Z7_9SPHI|nr:hypothetical protein SAMN05421740_11382 [Parapedobacter koreensis]
MKAGLSERLDKKWWPNQVFALIVALLLENNWMTRSAYSL